jgi:hypothetical protein
MALGSTEPLVKMSTRDVPGGKGGRCVRLTTYHHILPMLRNLGALTLLDPSGPAWPVMGVLYLYLLYSLFNIRIFPCNFLMFAVGDIRANHNLIFYWFKLS